MPDSIWNWFNFGIEKKIEFLFVDQILLYDVDEDRFNSRQPLKELGEYLKKESILSLFSIELKD